MRINHFSFFGALDDFREFVLSHISRIDAYSCRSLLALARFSKGRAAPKSILLSTDYVPSALVRELERIWHCSVYAHYGMTEMATGGGVECWARCGYHLREADLYLEIVDPASGKSLPDGERGRSYSPRSGAAECH